MLPGNPRAYRGKSGKGTELLGFRLQGIQDRKQRLGCGELLPCVRFEFCPMGPNL